MHWTQHLLLGLSAVCLLGNVYRYRASGAARLVGLAVCLGWVAQQLYWMRTGENSLVMFLLCDGIILWLATRERHWTNTFIAALIPVCWACFAAESAWGWKEPIWWTNWLAVTFQMVLGLPWPALQRIGFSISHGTRRGEAT